MRRGNGPRTWMSELGARGAGRPSGMPEGRSAGATISYVGHNTLALSVDGVRLLTDPMLRMRFQILRRHSAPPDLHVVEDLDAILISHLHLDHANPRIPTTPAQRYASPGAYRRGPDTPSLPLPQAHRTRTGGVGGRRRSDGHGYPCASRRAALSLGSQGGAVGYMIQRLARSSTSPATPACSRD